ncbi:protein kinase domain-containing protein [Ralstonia pickettii]|uniref:protein kinase domain-containing protein n=1 Tax=Ralstonia pickettii TaxID=329 RepID=UPI0015BCD339|nr:protein kinase [Ralstonia pickettii]NWK43324.1 protein kinase [Ralstonia pickettii]
MFLWALGKEFGEQRLADTIAMHLDKWGAVTGSPIKTPYSRVYRIQASPNSYPRQLFAKAPWFDPDTPHQKVSRRLERFVREAENTVRVALHPFVHRFGEVCFIHEVPFLISAGRDETLEDLINPKSLSVVDAFVIGIQIARGIGYCQHKGLIAHQDLKPANILVDRLERKFGPDFPIKYHARVADFELSNAYVELGTAAGARPYMSPEQHEIQHSPDQPLRDFSRSDVFSFGVLLHEMLTDGLHPVGEVTRDIWPNPIVGKNKWRHPEPWRKWVEAGAPIRRKLDTVPPEIYEILEDCLCVDSRTRSAMSSIEELLWNYLLLAAPDVARALQVMIEQWEEACLTSDPSVHWNHGERMLAMVRNYYATAR